MNKNNIKNFNNNNGDKNSDLIEQKKGELKEKYKKE